MDIIVSAYDAKSEEIQGLTSFNHLINALKIPVLTSEVNININKLIYTRCFLTMILILN